MNDKTASSNPGFARLVRHALVFGGGAGAIMLAWLLAEWAAGLHGPRIAYMRFTTMAAMLVPILAVMIGMMRWRDRVMGGTFKFIQAFGVALGIGLVFAVGAGLATWLYAGVINPGYIPGIIDFQAEAMRQANLATDEIARQVELTRQRATPAAFAYGRFVSWLMIAFVISLAAALVIRKKPLEV